MHRDPSETRRGVAAFTAAVLAVGGFVALTPAAAVAAPDGSSVVISEVYGGGGNGGAPLQNDFVELYNPTAEPVDLAGMVLEYWSAAGGRGDRLELTGTVPPASHFLVQMAAGSGAAAALPEPDLVGSAAMSATNGRVFLVDGGSGFDGSAAGDRAGADGLIDMVGYGSAASFETAAAPALSSTTSASRTGGADTDDNSADLSVGAPTPTNAAGETHGEQAEPEEPEQPVEPGTTIAIAEANRAASGTTVTVEGVVTADYREGGFNGFTIQDPAGDPADDVSDAVFVYNPRATVTPAVGDTVRVTGERGAYNGLRQISAGLVEVTGADLGEVEPLTSWDAIATEEGRQAHMSELVLPDDAFTVTDNYDANWYGSFVLVQGEEPLTQLTAYLDPHDAAAIAAQKSEDAARTITLDDGRSTNFNSQRNVPLSYLTPENPVRVGAQVDFRRPFVLDYRFDAWRLQPTTPISGAGTEHVGFSDERTPNAAPEPVLGDLSIANFNVLNYFPTTAEEFVEAGLGTCTYHTDREGNRIGADRCDPNGPRGAATAESLARQEAKLVAAIDELDASILSLQEMENSAAFGKDRDVAVATLVDALNEAAGESQWAYVESPEAVPADEDVIRSAFIYQRDEVEPVGESLILRDDPAFDNAREPLFQAFVPAGAGESDAFLVAANHFKSKGCSGATGANAEADDQGCYNADRIEQAQALVDYAEDVQEQTGIDAVFLTGDFNAYAMEDPAALITGAGYTNLNYALNGGEATYVYDGMSGSLDHVFANAEALARVSDVDVWQINAQEQVGFEYSRFNHSATLLYDESVFRTSDHNPIVVGIEADPAGPGEVDLQLLSINDFHGRIEADGDSAGAAVLAGAVDRLAARNPNTLLVSAGDNIGASTFTSFIQEDAPTIEALRAAGLAVSAVGNHEFDRGFADLTDRVIPAFGGGDLALGANVYRKGTETPALREYAIREIDGVRVGFIGTVTADTATLVSPTGIADIEFGDQLEAANRVAAEIADETDVIVLLTHDGSAGTDCAAIATEDTAYGELVRGASADIDAIVSGHTHQAYACELPAPGGGERPVMQSHQYGTTLGMLDLRVDTTAGELVSISASHIDLVDADGEPFAPADAEVQAIVDRAVAEADVRGKQVIGRITGDITRGKTATGSEDRGVESTAGNLVADIYLWAASGGNPAYGGTRDAMVGIMNPGGVRSDLLYGQDGSVTYEAAANMQPFANTLVTTTLTGAQLKQVLEEQWQPEGASRPKLHLGVSEGFSYEYDPDGARGSRVLDMTLNGEPVAPDDEILVVTNSFLAGGGDNFFTFADGAGTADSGLIDLTATVDYFAAHGEVDPAPLGRAVVADSNEPGPGNPGEPGTETPGTETPGTGNPGNGNGGAGRAPSVDDLAPERRGGIVVEGDLRPGGRITVHVDESFAGQRLAAWLFSEPTSLGTDTATAEGVLRYVLPEDVVPGPHRLAVVDASGEVIGWVFVTITAGGELAVTGAELPLGILFGATALLVAGGLLMVLRRRPVRIG